MPSPKAWDQPPVVIERGLRWGYGDIYPRVIEEWEKAALAQAGFGWPHDLRGFLSEEDRKALIALARDGLAAGRVTRRANALVLLDKV